MRWPWLMVSTLATLMVIPVSSTAMEPADSADGASMTVYLFQQDRLEELDLDEVVQARVVYEVNGRRLRTEHFVLPLDGGEDALFPVPDPARLARSADSPADVRILVYVGDFLIDSFDVTSFARYNRDLRRSRGADLERIAAAFEAEAPSVVDQRPLASAPLRSDTTFSIGERLLDPCVSACRQEYMDCVRNWLSGCETQFDYCLLDCPNWDSDGDGVNNGADNCDTTPNANQANCDGDSFGDVCDPENATWQTVIPESTCMTDKDEHFPYFTFEHHVDWLERDVSNCGNPDRWRRRIRSDVDCFNVSDYDCCFNGLATSIGQVGDDPFYWCSAGVRDVNFCH